MPSFPIGSISFQGNSWELIATGKCGVAAASFQLLGERNSLKNESSDLAPLEPFLLEWCATFGSPGLWLRGFLKQTFND
mgnify:CR=1 FL=1